MSNRLLIIDTTPSATSKIQTILSLNSYSKIVLLLGFIIKIEMTLEDLIPGKVNLSLSPSRFFREIDNHFTAFSNMQLFYFAKVSMTCQVGTKDSFDIIWISVRTDITYGPQLMDHKLWTISLMLKSDLYSIICTYVSNWKCQISKGPELVLTNDRHDRLIDRYKWTELYWIWLNQVFFIKMTEKMIDIHTYIGKIVFKMVFLRWCFLKYCPKH